MHKELVICIVIVSIVIFFNILTQNYTKNAVETINDKLESFKTILMEDEKNEDYIKNINNEIMKTWKEKNEVLAFYIEHDELEKVETELTSLGPCIDMEEYDDGIENIDKCIFILNHIKNKYIMEIKNIF